MQMQYQTVKQRQENSCLHCFCKKHLPKKRIALNYAYDFLCTYGLQKPVLGAGISPEWRGAGNTEMLAMRRLFCPLSRICVRDIRDLHRCLKGHCSVLVSLSSLLLSGVSIRLSFPLASGTSSSLFSRISFSPLLMRYCTSSFLFRDDWVQRSSISLISPGFSGRDVIDNHMVNYVSRTFQMPLNRL